MKRKMTLDELQYVQNEVKEKGKSTGLTYIFAILLGGLGIHLGYLEKKKLAVTRVALTILTVLSLFLMGITLNALQASELTMRLQQYSSIITVVLMSTVVTQLAWFLYELITIPGEVKKINSAIEGRAEDSIIHSRYAAEAILKGEVYQELIEDLKESASEKIENELDNKIDESKRKVTLIGNKVHTRELEVTTMTEKVNKDIQKLNKLKSHLDDEMDAIQKYMIKELGKLKSEVRNAVFKEEEKNLNSEKREKSSLSPETEEHKKEKPSSETISQNKSELEEETVHGDGFPLDKVDNQDVNVEKENGFLSIEESLSVKDGLPIHTIGYIVGSLNEGGELIQDKFNNDSSIVIADIADEKNIDNALAVQISRSSNLRGNFGLKSNSDLIGERIRVTGSRAKYFNHEGIKKVSKIELIHK